MKKLFLLSLLTTFGFSKAQVSYSVQPSKNMTVTAPYSSVTIFDIYQKNTSANKIILKWEKVSISLPSQWQYSMCDFGSCYAGIPVGPNTMDTVAGNGQGFLGLNIDPGTTDGFGVVKVYVYQNGFHSNGDTLTWYVKTLAAGVEEITTNSSIKIFPNPVQNNLNINLNSSETANIYLTDALGRKVLTAQAASNSNIDVSSLEKGFYTLIIETKDKTSFKRIIKD
jgi:hypothetical protein